MKNNRTMKVQGLRHCGGVAAGLFILMAQAPSVIAENTAITELTSISNLNVWVEDKAITDVSFSSLSGDKVQIELALNGAVDAPKVFQTNNPARISLDFADIHSNLDKKMFKVNQGAVKAVHVVEAVGRTRVVINLAETASYDLDVVDNKVKVVLEPLASVGSEYNLKSPKLKKKAKPDLLMKKENSKGSKNGAKSLSLKNKAKLRKSNLFPEQAIKNIDFRRGPKGAGRLLINLSSTNTIVDMKEQGGKVILNFLNTKLPERLAKSYDVSDFATPVQSIDAQAKGNGVSLTVSLGGGHYDYSSYQSDGMLAVDFIPLSMAEKKAMLKSKFPYSGKKLTFNFQDIEVRSVLQILADFTGLNIVAADTVGGNVSLRLNDVPWDQALDLILKSKGLAKREMGNVVLVAPSKEITKIEKEELEAKKVIQQLEPLKTEYLQINYAKAEDILQLLTGSNVVKSVTQLNKSSSGSGSNSGLSGGFGGFSGNNSSSRGSRSTESSEMQGMLSARGSATVDGRTNTIIVKETAKQLEDIADMIKILDVPVRQVMIEARIVTADTSFAQEIGVRFGIAKAAQIGSGKVFAMGAGQNTFGELVPDSNGSNVTVPDGAGYLVDLGANAIAGHPVGALGMTLARAADYVLNLELSALENNNRGEILANPRVMTSDREIAYIKQGIQIPYTTVSQDGTQTELIDAVLELNVTPQITPDGDVIMDLLIKKDSPDVATGGIDKREIDTMVRVRDGETIVLGGVYEGSSGNDVYKVPFLADLPGVGFLFQKKIESDRKKELLIFITPKIVKNTLSTR
ncbi:MAG: type IV pilus secretin PilQ [Methylococcaceae bacterium]|nr:type IV pilus secretin PilQ [Methylococcaceae bacterium]